MNRQAIRGYWLLRLYRFPTDRIHILVDGRIVASGGMELAEQLERDGYDAFREAADAAATSPAGV